MSYEGLGWSENHDKWFRSHDIWSYKLDPLTKTMKPKSYWFYVLLGLVLWGILAFAWYAIFTWLSQKGTKWDIVVNTQTGEEHDITTIGDLLFGTGKTFDDELTLSGVNGSWVISDSGVILTWVDRPYLEHLKKFMLILENDPNLKWYFDSDNIVLTWWSVIKIDPVTSLPSTRIDVSGTVPPYIKNLYIVWVDKSSTYYFNPIKINNGFWISVLDGIEGSLKPGENTYYIVWTDGTKYYINYIEYKTYDSIEFYKRIGKICVLDICTDPNLPLAYNDKTKSYLQQDNNIITQVIPGEYILIAQKCSGWAIGVTQVKKIWEVYQRVSKSCQYMTNGDVKQSFVNTVWETSINHDLMRKYPTSLRRGNIIYVADFAINGNMYNIQKLDTLPSNYDVSKYSIDRWYLVEEIWFELPDNVFVVYKLSNTNLATLGYTQLLPGSDVWSAYKITTSSFDWTTKPIIYTIPWSDPDMASVLNQKLLFQNAGRVVMSPGCGQQTSKTDPAARFGIYPIDDKYDLLWFLNCNMIIR